ncbi:hypothetical protein EMIHUDRAFT_221417 [Emiliania huxleyi CCMP1516]|uniref:Uncharacterized protein n=2 Tax=Emiliania huxleyi TaxID=2903 RepID=A0A0D3HZ29_EMIH1|nr:hypothetical protein EMIHUDRAFT_221417 [Emiliania huxleyi CCMP1516]EOD04264.1 hypothetical protein EMIHUDRAFT_221417 [Emiliania huxleyi CCMP1516]|eukprot:XP_005756693.1 hypothetical protein EMIHUDRAFT_221417 [Emiliania huxleyi CCMP1516]
MSLAGITLETKEGTKVPAAEALRGKIVVLFFSSEWHTLHEVARENEVPFEVVYVSSDRDAEQKARLRTAQPHGACHRNFKNTFSRLSEGAALHGRFP